MKGLFTVLATVMFLYVDAQSPEKMSYQAMIRNSNNELIIDQRIGIKITILKGSIYGTPVYSETQMPMTNSNGLISIEFGGSAGFDSIDWATGPYFIKTETDPLGGSNYTITGTSQLLSVPYALFANSSDYSNLINKPEVVSKHYFDSTINALKVRLFDEVWITNTSGQFKDTRDNQVYDFVKIGDQIWMAQNLNYYTSLGSYYYDNDSVGYARTYGRLYQWETSKNVCPSGWHLPTETEFIELFIYLDGPLLPGYGYPVSGKLKAVGTTHWQSPNANATNSAGFNAVPAGFWYSNNSTFSYLRTEARFWTSIEKFNILDQASPFTLQHDNNYVRDYGFLANYKSDALSVRCIKNK